MEPVFGNEDPIAPEEIEASECLKLIDKKIASGLELSLLKSDLYDVLNPLFEHFIFWLEERDLPIYSYDYALVASAFMSFLYERKHGKPSFADCEPFTVGEFLEKHVPQVLRIPARESTYFQQALYLWCTYLSELGYLPTDAHISRYLSK